MSDVVSRAQSHLLPLIRVQEPTASGRAQAKNDAAPQAVQAATEFEGLLLKQLTSGLFSSDFEDEDGEAPLGGDNSAYRQMFEEQIARLLAERGGVGVGKAIAEKVLLQAKSEVR
jgi:Rod binding domain-containing protein